MTVIIALIIFSGTVQVDDIYVTRGFHSQEECEQWQTGEKVIEVCAPKQYIPEAQ